jgi:hypothetical protein
VTYGDAIYLMPDTAQLHKFDDQGLRIS